MELGKIKESPATHIQTLSLNPFFACRLIHHFVKGYGKEVALPLIYLVLPFIYYLPTRKALIKCNSKSSIYTLFKDDTKKTIALGGFQIRYVFFKELTNNALIIAASEGRIAVGEYVTIKQNVHYSETLDKEIKDFFRAAHYLGVILSKLNVVNVFRLLGVNNL